MIRGLFISVFFSCVLPLCSFSQLSFPYNGIPFPDYQLIHIKNAVIHQDTGSVLISGQMLIQNGIIKDIGPSLPNVPGAIVLDFHGHHIYPSFIEPLGTYAIPEQKRNTAGNALISDRTGSYSWNDALRCDADAASQIKYNEETAAQLRDAGYALIQTHIPDGISRGSACILSLNQSNENEILIKSRSAHVMSFNKGSSAQEYPSSLMGSIALLRQTFLDGACYSKAIQGKEQNLTLEAWNKLLELPQIFVGGSTANALRASRIAKEFKQSFILVGDGKEYQQVEEIKKCGARFIIPLNFPNAYEVEDPFDAERISLADLKHWELAPANAAILAQNDIPFIFTSQGLKNENMVLTNIRKAIQNGLSPAMALYGLTLGPAIYLGIAEKSGSLAKGKMANFIHTDGPLFDDKTQILETWVRAQPYTNSQYRVEVTINAEYRLTMDSLQWRLQLNQQNGKMNIRIIEPDSSKNSISGTLTENYFNGKIDRGSAAGQILFYLWPSGQNWKGRALLEKGNWTDLRLDFIASIPDSSMLKKNKPVIDSSANRSLLFPFSAFGWKSIPQQKDFLIKNATVWTNEKEGILKRTDVLIQKGKIVNIGKNLRAGGSEIINGEGKHLTAGIIDEHSHIAISGGVNECTHSITSEVRIGDVIDYEDVNIYRQLAGGVTTSHLLHGSCNPIGGQTALIKLRWGLNSEQLKFGSNDPFIKFALGENVKRSGGNTLERYPDTRMGVEALYMDAFQRARQYVEARKTKPEETRIDLKLEALGQILEKKRFITCHSYVQSEINMLMKVAEHFNFTVNTFTHILEGYKLADIMKKHGAGAAGFSDWWAYKFEVYEAIPYNGAILHEQGVVTAYNSDDAEMARRLNQEAAKAVMYGNVPEEEALKFVTLNPAKLLHIDNRVGSIRIGKDADLVLWNDHPLSILATSDMTFVDGVKYWDKNEDLAKRAYIREERQRIIQKMIRAKNAGEKTEKFSSRRKRLYHCDSVFSDEEETEEN